VLLEDLDRSDLADRFDPAALKHGVVEAGIVAQAQHTLERRLERVLVQFRQR
jgi:hypothetical protein